MQPRVRRPPLLHCKQGLASHAEATCRSRVSLVRPAPGSVPNFGYQMRASLAREIPRIHVEGKDNRTPQGKKRALAHPVAGVSLSYNGGERIPQPLVIRGTLPWTGENDDHEIWAAISRIQSPESAVARRIFHSRTPQQCDLIKTHSTHCMRTAVRGHACSKSTTHGCPTVTGTSTYQ